jgi:putative transposase
MYGSLKGKRYTTEDKIRMLREADRREKSVADLCREKNISEVSFHRWKKQFGHMEINEARRLKELESSSGLSSTLAINSPSPSHGGGGSIHCPTVTLLNSEWNRCVGNRFQDTGERRNLHTWAVRCSPLNPRDVAVK